jgi:hypothetical protein
MTITWKVLLSSVFSSPTKWRLGTHAAKGVTRKLRLTLATQLVDQLGLPVEHDVFLVLNGFFLRE